MLPSALNVSPAKVKSKKGRVEDGKLKEGEKKRGGGCTGGAGTFPTGAHRLTVNLVLVAVRKARPSLPGHGVCRPKGDHVGAARALAEVAATPMHDPLIVYGHVPAVDAQNFNVLLAFVHLHSNGVGVLPFAGYGLVLMEH